MEQLDSQEGQFLCERKLAKNSINMENESN